MFFDSKSHRRSNNDTLVGFVGFRLRLWFSSCFFLRFLLGGQNCSGDLYEGSTLKKTKQEI